MKILFVWPNIESKARYEANMGIALISAVLKNLSAALQQAQNTYEQAASQNL